MEDEGECHRTKMCELWNGSPVILCNHVYERGSETDEKAVQTFFRVVFHADSHGLLHGKRSGHAIGQP